MSDTAQFEVAEVLGESDRQSVRLVEARTLVSLCAVIFAVAVLLCVLQPQHRLAWLGAAAFLPAVLSMLWFSAVQSKLPEAARASLSRTLIGAGLLILVPLVLRLAEGFGWLDIIDSRRAIGVLLGIAVAVAGSAMKARLLPLLKPRFEPALAQKLARLFSAALMLAGCGYCLVWLAAPANAANLWASVVLTTAVVLTALRSVLLVNHHNPKAG